MALAALAGNAIRLNAVTRHATRLPRCSIPGQQPGPRSRSTARDHQACPGPRGGSDRSVPSTAWLAASPTRFLVDEATLPRHCEGLVVGRYFVDMHPLVAIPAVRLEKPRARIDALDTVRPHELLGCLFLGLIACSICNSSWKSSRDGAMTLHRLAQRFHTARELRECLPPTLRGPRSAARAGPYLVCSRSPSPEVHVMRTRLRGES